MKTGFEPNCFAVLISPGPYALIEVGGELDLAAVPVLQAAIRKLDLPTIKHAVLDLRRLDFIDAAGLDSVLELYAECLDVSTALTIMPGPRNVQRVFELTRVDRLLPFSRP